MTFNRRCVSRLGYCHLPLGPLNLLARRITGLEECRPPIALSSGILNHRPGLLHQSPCLAPFLFPRTIAKPEQLCLLLPLQGNGRIEARPILAIVKPRHHVTLLYLESLIHRQRDQAPT